MPNIGLIVSESTSEVYIDKQFEDLLEVFEFYLHISTEGGDYGAKTVTPKLVWRPSCVIGDITTSEIPDQSFTYSRSIETVERFTSTMNENCSLRMCEVRDSECESALDEDNL